MHAFGAPGISPTWSSSDKDLVGCSLGPARLWFTCGRGIVNEVFHPRVDLPQIRDLGFIVADGAGFWVEIKRLDNYRIEVPAPGIPAVAFLHKHERFTLTLRIAPDSERDVLLIEVVLEGDPTLRPYALLAPHLGGSGHDNLAGSLLERGRRVLWATQGPYALALCAANPQQADAFGSTSAGHAGASDGWQDFDRHGRMTWDFDAAGPGNVALTGALPQSSTLALAFAPSRESAATLAVAALCQPFEEAWRRHVAGWKAWQRPLPLLRGQKSKPVREQIALSAMVLRVHQDKVYPGAMVASLSVPWGNTHDDVGGYHLVWPRDLVESAGGLLALGAEPEARNILRYLIATQREGGNWSQNQWLGGQPYWRGDQLDETAFPVLLAAALHERDALAGIEVGPMVRRALAYLVATGPVTQQDRWEEDGGLNAFTLATCIAALVCGAEWLDAPARNWALRIADDWNANIERWTWAQGSTLAQAHGVEGHYVRIAPPPETEVVDVDVAPAQKPLDRVVPIKNRAVDPGLPAREQVATDFLQLVRLGLRDAHDPLIVQTVRVIDAELKTDTPNGPVWHRYNGDGYGEQADGSAYDGTGIGRGWPLLIGERGHYELVAGRDPLPLLLAMSKMTGRGGLLPEQVWDRAPIPERSLAPGRPSGSAMPLVWAHSEFVKLLASRALGRPFDRPACVWARYQGKRPTPQDAIWTPSMPVRRIAPGQALWLLTARSAQVHCGFDGWQRTVDLDTRDTGLSLHAAALPTAALQAGARIDFTLRWTDEAGGWAGRDWRVDIIG